MQKNHIIERLEDRIAPATLVNPTTVVFSDVDGDDVTVHISKPLFNLGNFTKALAFSDSAVRTDGTLPQSLITFDVKQLGVGANGLDISITSKLSAKHGGNGHVDIGGIDAFTNGDSASIDLGKVRVQGDLRFIDAGDSNFTTPALKSLDADSVGAVLGGIKSEINGSIGVWKVRGNMDGTLLQSGPATVKATTIAIGGSLGTVDMAIDQGSSLNFTGSVGTITIGHDIVGGKALGAGSILIGQGLGALNVGGSIRGGEGNLSAFLTTTKSIGSIRIHGDLIGGTGQTSGALIATTQGLNIGTLRIDGSLIGGSGSSSGSVQLNHVTNVIVGHDLIGQSGEGTGSLIARAFDHITIGGSMIGAKVAGIPNQTFTTGSGSIFASEQIGTVTVGGDVIRANIVAGVRSGNDLEYGGGTDAGTDVDTDANILAKIASITIKGSVSSGSTGHFGIEANAIGALKIGSVKFAHTDKLLDFKAGFTVDSSDRFTVREL